MTHGETKQMIIKAKSFEQIDKIIDATYCKNEGDKIEYLASLFALKPKHTQNKHESYRQMVSDILQKSA